MGHEPGGGRSGHERKVRMVKESQEFRCSRGFRERAKHSGIEKKKNLVEFSFNMEQEGK
jgi:hypothetical protein